MASCRGQGDEDRRDGFPYGGWAAAANDPVMQEVMSARMGSAWSLLVGRTTYESLYRSWATQPSNPMTDALNNVEKFVASATLSEPLPWQNSILLWGDAADVVARLKQDHDKTLVIFGSGVLVQSLMRRGLIDEYVVLIYPLVLGTGRRLFPDGSPPTRFRLVESVTTATGVIIAAYQVATER